MALITDFLVQGGQMLLILLLAPLLTGWVRTLKAQLLRRRGPSLLQPYRDLLKLLQAMPEADLSAEQLAAVSAAGARIHNVFQP